MDIEKRSIGTQKARKTEITGVESEYAAYYIKSRGSCILIFAFPLALISLTYKLKKFMSKGEHCGYGGRNTKNEYMASDQTERVYIFPIFLGYSVARKVILKARFLLICEVPL